MILIQRSAPALPVSTTHSRLILSFSIVSLGLAIIAVMLRVYARYLKRLSFVAEDYLVFAALFGFVVQIILTCNVVVYGAAGHPQSTVSPENVRASLQILAGQGPCFGLVMTCSKWSICLLYKRIFVVRSFRIVTYFTMVLIFGWGILAFTVTWAFCKPIAYGWDPTIPGGHCANRDAGLLLAGIIDAITDLIILILPMPVIWRLQIPRSKQVSLVIIFSIAILSIVISALRAYYTSMVVFSDFTDSRTFLDTFSNIEPGISIIVASSLVCGPIIQKWSHFASFCSSSKLSSSKRTTQSFRRIRENTEESLSAGFELEQNKTTIQGDAGEGEWPQAHIKGSTIPGDITVQTEFMVH